MNSLQNRLNAYYPFITNDWKQLVVPLLVVFATLYLFRPFGLNTLNNELSIFLAALCFSGFSALANYGTNSMLAYMGHHFFNTEQWTVGKNIALDIIKLGVITMAVFLCGVVINTWTFNFSIYMNVIAMVVSVSIFPITITTFSVQNRLLKEHLKCASQINTITPHTSPEAFQMQIGEFALNSESFMYAESCGNYVTIAYIEMDTVKQKTIRTTLKTIPEGGNIIRCHRAYYVNLNKVIHASGNSQGLRLQLQKCMVEIPVSRAYTPIVKEKVGL